MKALRRFEEFPEIADKIDEVLEKDTYKQDAPAIFIAAVKRLEKELKIEEIKIDRKDLAGMVAQLRNMGNDNPSIVDIKDALEFESIDKLLAQGIE